MAPKPKGGLRRKTVASPKTASGPINTKPKLPFIAPLVGFLTAGLTKLVSWDVGWEGIALLVGFAAAGGCLQYIPRRSAAWPTVPGSSQATLKQTIATMRVLISIVMVAVPVTILATNKQALKFLPSSVENYLGQLNAGILNGGSVSVALEPEIPRNVLLFVPTETVASALPKLVFQPTPLAQTAPSAINGAVTGKLYILKTTKVVEDIVSNTVMPKLHLFATTTLILSAIFVLVIFYLEVIGDLLWSMQPKRRTKG